MNTAINILIEKLKIEFNDFKISLLCVLKS